MGGGHGGLGGQIVGVCSVKKCAVEYSAVFVEKLHHVCLAHKPVGNAFVGLSRNVGGGRTAAVSNAMARA